MMNPAIRLALALAPVALVLSPACEAEPEPANWLFHGQWLDVAGHDREADETCAGSFAYLDRYAGAIALEFGVDSALGTYNWYSPAQYDTDAPCGELAPFACAWPGEVETPMVPDEHEIVHLADFRVSGCPSVIAEGLAGYHATLGRTPEPSANELLAARLRDPSNRIEAPEYPISARFVGFLVERFGLAAILELCSTTGRYPDADQLTLAMESVLGAGRESLLEEFDRLPAECSAFDRYQSHVFACGVAAAAPDAGVAGLAGPAFEANYVIDCAEPATLGPREGRIWIAERIDLVRAGDYQLSLRGAAEDFAETLVGVEAILTSCEPCGGARRFSAGAVIEAQHFDAGRYALELRAPEGLRAALTLTVALAE